jgi:hypothetical protein
MRVAPEIMKPALMPALSMMVVAMMGAIAIAPAAPALAARVYPTCDEN